MNSKNHTMYSEMSSDPQPNWNIRTCLIIKQETIDESV